MWITYTSFSYLTTLLSAVYRRLSWWCSLYSLFMTTNPYIAQVMLQTGATEREVVTDMMPPLRPMTFPCVIYGRTFDTHDEYIDAMYDYLGSL